MPLQNWIKEASLLFAEKPHRIQRSKRRRALARTRAGRQTTAGQVYVRSSPESLEDRALPASLVWVGDINPLFQTDTSGNTNWDTNTLPASGDQLTFPDIAGDRSLTNEPLHQNLWVTCGVGSFPSVCRSATSATLYDLNP